MREAVKGLFKAAVKAITRRDPDAPRVCRRRGETGGELRKPAPAKVTADRPAMRGRFAGLLGGKSKAARVLRKFMRASDDIVYPFADDDLYMLEVLPTLNPCDHSASGDPHHEVAIDNESGAQQNRYFPQP
jgi:hypothetical protein